MILYLTLTIKKKQNFKILQVLVKRLKSKHFEPNFINIYHFLDKILRFQIYLLTLAIKDSIKVLVKH